MAIDAANFKVRHVVSQTVNVTRRLVADAEFVFFQSGRNIGVRFRVYVRIDTQRNGSLNAHFSSNLVDAMKLRYRLNVEAADPYF